jgi:ribosomal protein S18 acetylase RimI-like enzyme
MKPIIRKWQELDLEELLRLNDQWGYVSTLRDLREQLKKIDACSTAEVFVAEVQGIVRGRIFVMEHLTMGSEPYVEIQGLVVDENFRQVGIGRALVEKAKEWGRERGFAMLRLRSNVNRREANLFYPAIGFTLEKQQNVYGIHL